MKQLHLGTTPVELPLTIHGPYFYENEERKLIVEAMRPRGPEHVLPGVKEVFWWCGDFKCEMDGSKGYDVWGATVGSEWTYTFYEPGTRVRRIRTYWDIGGVWTWKNRRGLGVAGALVDAQIAYARSRKYLWVDCLTAHYHMDKVCERRDMQIVGGEYRLYLQDKIRE